MATSDCVDCSEEVCVASDVVCTCPLLVVALVCPWLCAWSWSGDPGGVSDDVCVVAVTVFGD